MVLPSRLEGRFGQSDIRLHFVRFCGDVGLIYYGVFQADTIKWARFRIVAVAGSRLFRFVLSMILQNLPIMRCYMRGHIRHTAVTDFYSVSVENLV